MLLSIVFVILFILCLVGVVLLPKRDGKINGIKAGVMAVMTIFCYQALMAFVYSHLGLTVGIETTTVSMAIADIGLWAWIIWKRKIQRLFFRLPDILSLAVLAWIVIEVSLHLFTPELRLSYLNTDPANHFKFAMCIVEYGTIDSIYFSAFVDAIFIELLAPMLAPISYYKAFIVADIFMHILEVWMFYVLILTISEKKVVRILAPFLTLFYFWGYPAYSYMTGGFVYWSNGVMIFILMIYALLLFERANAINWQLVVLLVLAAYANSCCNRLFVPVNYFVFFVALIVFLWKKKKHTINKKLFWGVMAAVAVIAVIAAAGFWNYWGGSVQRMLEYVAENGGIYRAMYADLIFFVPVAVFVFYYTLYKQMYSGTLSLMAVCTIFCAVVMYIFWRNALMSTYYYYKIYYNLWLFGWLLVVAALDIASEKKQLTGIFAYGGMLILMGVISLTDYDALMEEEREDYNAYYATSRLFPLYRFNMDSFLTDYETYELSSVVLDVYAYALEHTQGEFVPLISSLGEYRYWFDGMKAQDSDGVRADKYSLEEILGLLDAWGVNKILVVKTDEFFSVNVDYFEQCEPVYENDEAALYTFSGESWTEAYQMLNASVADTVAE